MKRYSINISILTLDEAGTIVSETPEDPIKYASSDYSFVESASAYYRRMVEGTFRDQRFQFKNQTITRIDPEEEAQELADLQSMKEFEENLEI